MADKKNLPDASLQDVHETVYVTGGGYRGIALINKRDYDYAGQGHILVTKEGNRLDPVTGVVLTEEGKRKAEAEDAKQSWAPKPASDKDKK